MALRLHDAAKQRNEKVEADWSALKAQRNAATSRLATVAYEKRKLAEQVRNVLLDCTGVLDERRRFTRLADERQAVERVRAQLSEHLRLINIELSRQEEESALFGASAAPLSLRSPASRTPLTDAAYSLNG